MFVVHYVQRRLFSRPERLYLVGLVAVFFCDDILSISGLESRFQFLPLLMYSTYCSVATLATFVSLYRQLWSQSA
jgi:hypothetical protein